MKVKKSPEVSTNKAQLFSFEKDLASRGLTKAQKGKRMQLYLPAQCCFAGGIKLLIVNFTRKSHNSDRDPVLRAGKLHR